MNDIIVDVKLMPNTGGKLKATADVSFATEFGELTILKLRILEVSSSNLWIALPQESYEKDGKKHYSNIVLPSRSLKKKIDDLVLTKYHELKNAA